MRDDRQSVEEYLASKGWAWKERSGELVLDCPFCGKANHLYMRAADGVWSCKVCARAGNLHQMRQELGDGLAVSHLQHATPAVPSAPVSRPKSDLPTRDEWERAVNALWSADIGAAVALDYLMGERQLTADVIRDARLGLVSRWGKPWIGIPFLGKDGGVLSLKLRSAPPAPKTFARVEGAPSLLYGAETLAGASEVVLTEGEMDVLAMRAYGYSAVASTSLGARGWAKEWGHSLSKATTILLAYDQDEEGDAGAVAVAQTLGTSRCLRVRLPHKDAGDCLRLGVGVDVIRDALLSAEPVTGPRVRHLASFSAEALHDAESGKGDPTPWTGLTNLLGGIRRGDLHIVTGRTGEGKSTWAINLAYRRADAGSPVLLFPAEQRPADVFRKVAAACIVGSWFDASDWARQSAAEMISRLPLYCIAHYGRVDPDELHDAIRYAVQRLFVRDVILDHLHFFWPIRGGDGERGDIGDAVRAIKVWAQELGVTIWLVVQPAKTKGPVGIDDLRGSAELQQTPDTVIVVRRDRASLTDSTKLAVEKCRFEGGREGVVTLLFDRLSQSYSESIPSNVADDPPFGPDEVG